MRETSHVLRPGHRLRRGGSRGPGPGTASGWPPSTSKPSAIPWRKGFCAVESPIP